MLTSNRRVEFAVCVANEGYDDLEVWKVSKFCPMQRLPAWAVCGSSSLERTTSTRPIGSQPWISPDGPVAATEMAAKPWSQGAASGHQEKTAAERQRIPPSPSNPC